MTQKRICIPPVVCRKYTYLLYYYFVFYNKETGICWYAHIHKLGNRHTLYSQIVLSKNKKNPCNSFHALGNRDENTLLSDAYLETLTILLFGKAVSLFGSCANGETSEALLAETM